MAHRRNRKTPKQPRSPAKPARRGQQADRLRWGKTLGVVLTMVGLTLWAVHIRQSADGDQSGGSSGVHHNSAEPHSEEHRDAFAADQDQKKSIPTTAHSPTPNPLDDPAHDGWDSESFADAVKHQLEKLGASLGQPANLQAEVCDSLVAAEFRSSGLIPQRLERVFQHQGIRVERSKDLKTTPTTKRTNGLAANVQPAEVLAKAITELAARFPNAERLRFHPKVVQVQLDNEGGTTTQQISITAHTSSGIVEQHAIWEAAWRRGGEGTQPRLKWLQVVDFEETCFENSPITLLNDCTASVFARIPSFAETVLPGYRDWLPQMAHDFRVDSSVGYPALATGDVNGDGLDDLYVCQSMGLPNLLLVQQPDGTVREVAADWGIDWLHESRSALLVDLDNDGDQDLAVAVDGGLIVAVNQGERFDVRTVLPAADDTTSLSACDYDQDGKLDLYLCAYQAHKSLGEARDSSTSSAAGAFVYHDSDQGAANLLWRNEGDWRFVNVTGDAGLDENNARHSYAASWEDYDNDGDMDLYVANDYGPNCLYRNNFVEDADRTFTEVAATAKAQDRASGMSVAWGDYDRDGWMDVYVSNMFSSAGNRVVTQPQFRPEADADLRQQLQRFARGNTLLRNQGDGTFDDSSLQAGVTMGRWAWSSNFVDLNNDGWEDLLVANGMITGDDSGDL